jgi:tetratricopeptide (TPR) repeat protein
MFEQKLLRGDLIGFFGSVNTSAAVGVMLFAACAGIGIFRFRAGDGPGWLGYSGVAAAALVWELIEVQSKTSAATPVLGLAVIAIWAGYGHRLRRYRGRVFLTALAVAAAAAIVVAGIGLKTGTLFAGHFSNSLDFRWKYWTAAAGVFRGHPLLGVGYDNFGPFYLAHRRPDAAEEVKDPHNLIVRFFTELGIVGGLLLLAWLARLGWELLGPADTSPDSADAPPTIREPMVIAAAATGLAIIANTDFDYDLIAQVTLLLRFVIYGLAILFGAVAGSLLDSKSHALDPRPARWVYACMATGLGLFFVHNMIDFPWAETGALLVFAAIAGAALGMTESSMGSAPRSRAVPVAMAAVAVIIWLAAAGAIGFPVVAAEGMVASAAGLVRSAPADPAMRVERFGQAAALYRQAADMVPYNADYKFQLARAEVTALADLPGIPDPNARDAAAGRYRSVGADIAAAIRADPTRINALLLEAENPPAGPRAGQVTVRDFDAAVRLDPNDVGIRREYGEALDRMGRRGKAAAQYRAALAADAALPAGEPKRLPADQVAALRKLAAE